jgi:pimeloyl-ACP methyl ester carboxylesterase
VIPSVVHVRTPDGARLALHRYAPPLAGEAREPVLMISGYGLNRHALDYDDRYSWARPLAAAGFDTWILELRGSGLSSFAGRRDGSFDDYLVDVQTAVAHVLGDTGAERLHWVGYSLGGMLLYAFLASAPDTAPVRSGVVVEAPVDLSAYDVDAISRVVFAALQRLGMMQRIPYRLLTHLLRPVLPRLFRRPVFARWMNPDNIDPLLLHELMPRVVDDVPTALAAQLLEWIREGRWTAEGRGEDLLRRVGEVDVPLLLLTGRGEFSDRAREALERFRPGTMEWVECAACHGFRTDYGHADLLFGRRAPEEVFPHVRRWLERHSGGSRATM